MEPFEAKVRTDTDMYAAKRTADQIVNLLDGFIPSACRREAWRYIAEACYKEGFELTSKRMRKEYEAWKQLQVNSLGLSSPCSKPE